MRYMNSTLQVVCRFVHKYHGHHKITSFMVTTTFSIIWPNFLMDNLNIEMIQINTNKYLKKKILFNIRIAEVTGGILGQGNILLLN